MASHRPIGSSLDRDAARQAWRQFARMHGVDRRPEGPSAPKLGLIIGGVVIAAVVVLGADQLGGDELQPASSADASPNLTEASMTHRHPPTTRGTAGAGAEHPSPVVIARAATSPAPALGGAPERDLRAELPSHAELQPHAEIQPEAPVTPRVAPVGTSVDAEKAFLRVPKGREDRSPRGAVGVSGLHVDRISMGTGFSNSRCKGPANNFSIAAGDAVNVCFRAVHLRRNERVRVVWEHDGRRALQTRLRIPSRHAFRTRAGLRLQDGYAGRWRVSVQSLGGAELASAEFDVSP